MHILPDVALTLLVGLLTAPLILHLLRRAQLLDVPTWRSSHATPTPRGGGLAPALACLAGAVFSTNLTGVDRQLVITVATGMGVLGLLDDLRGLGPIPRLVAQLGVSSFAVLLLLTSPATRHLSGAVALLTTVLWLVSYTNAFNFMDGINGLSVAQATVAGITWMLLGTCYNVPSIAALGVIVLVAALTFAPYNFPRAAMFLGDVGSYFLGGWLASAAVLALRASFPPEIVLAPLGLYAVDTSYTLARRVMRHEPWYRAHHDHIYQRLIAAGWTHFSTTLLLTMTMVAVTAFSAFSLTASPALRALGDLFGLVVLAGYVKLPSLLTVRTAGEAQ